MVPTFLKIAVRNFIKEKFYSGINILGLSVGIAAALLIALFIVHELSFDRFHVNVDRIYRIGMHLEMGGNAGDMNATFPQMADALAKESSDVEKAIRLYQLNGKIFKHEEKIFSEDKVMYADSDFFKVFNFNLLAGNPRTALSKRYQVLLTPTTAAKYFDTRDWSQIIGKSILINKDVHEITGIIEEAPANSHFSFSSIASIESTPQGRDKTWDNLNLSTYVLLKPGAKIETVLKQIRKVFQTNLENYDKLGEQGVIMEAFAQPLKDIHLHSNIQGEFLPTGNIRTLYIFGAVAVMVILLASVNFINLVTARSANRAKEVGVRKVLGSSSRQLMRQFIAECIVLVTIATLIALGIAELARTPFTTLSGKSLPFHLLLSGEYLGYLFIFVVVLGVFAGIYPAFFLSSFQPAKVLKGTVKAGFRSGKLRNVLVTMQFAISMVLITCTLVVQRQLEFMRSTKLGFDKENVIVIDNADRLSSQQAFITSISQIPSVEHVGSAAFKPVDDYDGMLVTSETDKENRKLINFSRVDYQFLPTMKFEFLEGRNFSEDMASDSASIILNQRAADMLFNGNAMGKKMDNGKEYTVIGVIRNFNFESLKNEVRPLVFLLQKNQRFLHVRVAAGDPAPTLRALEAAWKDQTSDVPFSYAFLDETYTNLYREETQLGRIFSVFTGLALFIACLGLMGLAAYMAEQRKKEISVRKVLGATAGQVVNLLSQDFVRIVAIAILLAGPAAYFLMDKWLSTFAYRVDVPIITFAAGAVIILAIALLAVSYQSIRAALVNPVDSLKDE